MPQGQQQGFSESQLALYHQEYYERADLVFRFGSLLTTSREGGERITEAVFRLLIQDFAKISADMNPAKILMALAWKVYQQQNSERFHEWNAPILQSMKALSAEQRASLFMAEIAGIEPADMAKVLKCEEGQVRKYIAGANKFLSASKIRV